MMPDEGVIRPLTEAEIELQHREASWLDFELAHDHRKRQAKKNAELEASCFAINPGDGLWSWITCST